MNDIDKMPVKCRDCAYWELATYPWCCGDCKDIMNPKNGEYIKRIDAKRALTALSADLDAETVQRCIEAMNNLPAADVVPAPVRCSECRFYNKRDGGAAGGTGWCSRPGAGCGVPEAFFCAGAERKEADNV